MPEAVSVFDQSNRLAKIYTPLPDGEVVLMDLHGSEHVNGPTHFIVRVLTSHGADKIEPLLGEPVSIEVSPTGQAPRHIHQIVDGVRYIGPQDTDHVYELELRPWLWMLGRRVNSRIFKEQSILDIVRQIVSEYGLDPKLKLREDASAGAQIEYLVQYNETDLAFVLRLLEREGINYHCVMEPDAHTVVLSNQMESFADAPGPDRSYSPVGDRGDQAPENFSSWLPQRQLTPGMTRMLDYNFKTPTAAMDVDSSQNRPFTFSNLETFIYPGNYLSQSEGRAIAKRLGDAQRMADATVTAEGNAPSLAAGTKFKLGAHPDSSQHDTYVVMSAHHSISNGNFRSGAASAGDGLYRGSYQFARSSIPILPLPVTEKPRIYGPQTAVVTDGAEGEIDEYGRITVRFFWAPESESMKCRVSQIWAARDWGSLFIPHTGMEVIVEFLNGDPDYPLVTGCVWNAENKPDLPANKLVSGFKTVRENSLLFIDKEGAELIGIKARKDMVTVVMNDDKHVVHNKRTTKITSDVSEKVGGNVSTEIKGSETHKAQGDILIQSDSKIELKVGSSSITIDSGSITLKAMNITVDAQGALTTKAAATADHSATGNMTIKAALVMIN